MRLIRTVLSAIAQLLCGRRSATWPLHIGLTCRHYVFALDIADKVVYVTVKVGVDANAAGVAAAQVADRFWQLVHGRHGGGVDQHRDCACSRQPERALYFLPDMIAGGVQPAGFQPVAGTR